MKLLVAVKRVVDFNTRIRVKPDGSGVDLSAVKMAVNPFCEIALEEALRLREKGVASSVVAVTVGPVASSETLRSSLSLGADRAVHVTTPPGTPLAPLGVACTLAALVAREAPSLVLLGKQAIDDDAAATGQLLAGLLGWPQAIAASAVDVLGGDGAVLGSGKGKGTPGGGIRGDAGGGGAGGGDAGGGGAGGGDAGVGAGGVGGGGVGAGATPASVRVTREVDGGLQTVRLGLPAVVTADLRLNVPRYATLPNIMRAKKKKIETIAVEDLGVDVASKIVTLKVEAPPARPPGVIVNSVAELVDKLKNEAKVI